ncbi:catalase KatX [Bacillus subtilis subsp. subtilis]|uniref:Catalase n=1 Tax=Bacillus subtilis subsp. subtilis TaxID=135461 RepID=A0ABD3ZW25_BACIU|nr:catalase KatX [Bacillus subtilis]KIL32316.1 Catalase [Bacillus subtilis subsp. subtilis]KIN58766.1 Catalase [Bacillus subtilis]MBP3045594.1 catalase KatX [Bacillus subtilis subsp. subtilis]MED1675111.1 catalase KatX [Bacillus subtilis]
MKDDHQNKQHQSNAQGSEEVLSHKTSGKNESEDTLTNRQGHPVTDNQNVRTVGNRGPTTLENYDFLEKISHFDRERIPERVVHARGAGAHGYFEAYGSFGDEPISTYTRAKLFQEKGKKTPAFVRFSTVNHGKHSPETLRDPRGFAVKLYTEDGNWDLVGNNLKIFFIRDPLKFPDLVHAFQPDPVTNIQDGERIFDFISQSPEATHMITFLFSPWGIPANYRQMQGSGVHAYKWVNEEGKAVLVKYHFEPKQGIRNLTQKEAEEIQGKNFNHATQDLYDAIENGDYPEWEVYAQIMSDDEHPELDFDPLDPTKLWYKDDFPWKPIGKLVLNKNPENYHAEVEQASFGTGVLVDGLDFSDDKLLQGRTFAYSDTQRYRVGANYLQLPINSPKKHVATNQEGGQMQYRVDRAEGQNPHVNYEPSIMGGLKEAKQDGKDHTPHVEGDVKREAIDRTNNLGQAGETYRRFTEFERNELITNLVNTLSTCRKEIQDQMIENFTKADPDYGKRVAEGLKKVSENNSNGPIGTTETEQAAKQAEQESHPSDPY